MVMPGVHHVAAVARPGRYLTVRATFAHGRSSELVPANTQVTTSVSINRAKESTLSTLLTAAARNCGTNPINGFCPYANSGTYQVVSVPTSWDFSVASDGNIAATPSGGQSITYVYPGDPTDPFFGPSAPNSWNSSNFEVQLSGGTPQIVTTSSYGATSYNEGF